MSDIYDVALIITATGGALSAVLGVLIKGAPEYRKHMDWRDRRRAKRERQVLAITDASPTTGTITKRSA